MRTLPFHLPGRFYRGNLHTHSTRSDGALPPPEVIAAYRDHGYDFLSLTDHFLEQYGYPMVDTREYRRDGFTTIIGAELHAPALANGERWHILAVGLPLDFAIPTADERGPALARRARVAGAFVAIAHPYWYNLTTEDAISLDAAHAVEIWNTGCGVEVDRGDSWYMSDLLNERGIRLTACATDDAHFKATDYRGGWVQVRSESLEPDALVAALKAGHYYSSRGPEIRDVRFDGDHIGVESSPAATIIVHGRGAKNERVVSKDGTLTSARLPLTKFVNSYCRVIVVDAAGRHAWTNPIWL
ncbi:MAG: phosphotransferase [Chloroflexota bacterium]|nr:MAG: phosphotransferase [Chloroflexota bacterium]